MRNLIIRIVITIVAFATGVYMSLYYADHTAGKLIAFASLLTFAILTGSFLPNPASQQRRFVMAVSEVYVDRRSKDTPDPEVEDIKLHRHDDGTWGI